MESVWSEYGESILHIPQAASVSGRLTKSGSDWELPTADVFVEESALTKMADEKE